VFVEYLNMCARLAYVCEGYGASVCLCRCVSLCKYVWLCMAVCVICVCAEDICRVCLHGCVYVC
jgi:heme exporter protein D